MRGIYAASGKGQLTRSAFAYRKPSICDARPEREGRGDPRRAAATELAPPIREANAGAL